MEKLAIFDVDYTLTKKETLIEFYKFVALRSPLKLIYLPRALLSGLLYVSGVYKEKQVKESFLKFIDGLSDEDMKLLVKDFYEKRLSRILYEDGVAMMKKLKDEGYKVYLISASPEFYLNELYNLGMVDKIIGTRYFSENGKQSRRMNGENCKGQEKVKRLKEELAKEGVQVDYKNSYMFSDSLSDKPLFDLVGNAYLINYKKKHDAIEILKWK